MKHRLWGDVFQGQRSLKEEEPGGHIRGERRKLFDQCARTTSETVGYIAFLVFIKQNENRGKFDGLNKKKVKEENCKVSHVGNETVLKCSKCIWRHGLRHLLKKP